MSGVLIRFSQMTDEQLFTRYDKLDSLYGACLNNGHPKADLVLALWEDVEAELVLRNLMAYN